MIPISNSKKESFDCPFYFLKRYVKRVAPPTDKALFLEEGNFLHSVTQVYTEKLAEHNLQSDNDLLDLVTKELWKAQTVLPQSYFSNIYSAIKRFGERALLDLTTFWRAEYGVAFNRDLEPIEFPNLHNYQAEDQWCAENDIFVHMRLDKIDIDPSGTIAYIRDYKSARKITSQTELERRGQGQLYAWGLMQINPAIQEVYVIFDFIRFGTDVTLHYDRASVAHVPKMLEVFHEKVEALDVDDETQWGAKQGIVCPLCAYTCPLNDPSLELPAVVQDIDAAEKLTQKVLAMKREISQIEGKLKTYVEERGAVTIGAGEYRYNTSRSLPYTVGDIIVFTQSHEMDPQKFLSVDREKTEKQIALMDEEKEKSFRSCATGKSRTTSRFGFKKSEIVKVAEAEILPPETEDDGGNII